MLYSNEKQGTTSFRGKVWRLPGGLWRACNYNGQQCNYKLYNEAFRFSQKGKPVNEASDAHHMLQNTIRTVTTDRLVKTRNALRNSTNPDKENLLHIYDNELRDRGVTEGLKRQRTRYFPDFNKREMEQLVTNLISQGYKASAKGPNIKTDATDFAIDNASLSWRVKHRKTDESINEGAKAMAVGRALVKNGFKLNWKKDGVISWSKGKQFSTHGTTEIHVSNTSGEWTVYMGASGAGSAVGRGEGPNELTTWLSQNKLPA